MSIFYNFDNIYNWKNNHFSILTMDEFYVANVQGSSIVEFSFSIFFNLIKAAESQKVFSCWLLLHGNEPKDCPPTWQFEFCHLVGLTANILFQRLVFKKLAVG